VLSERYPEAEVTVAEPKRPLLARLGIGGAASSLLTAIEHRAIWSRYGL
jgi:hypothetical protein